MLATLDCTPASRRLFLRHVRYQRHLRSTRKYTVAAFQPLPPLTPVQAEEDAARRLNVGRVLPSAALSGTNSRAKHTELIGKPFLRQKVEAACMSLLLAYLTCAHLG